MENSNFKLASKLVQQHLTLSEIHNLWEQSSLGRPANRKTIKRWVNLGPKTKNPRFEPFICSLALDLLTNGIESIKAKLLDENDRKVQTLKAALDNYQFRTAKQEATAASLVAFYERYPSFSKGQQGLLDSMCARVQERRVFYIDVGKMPPQRSKQYLEQIKNEIKQK